MIIKVCGMRDADNIRAVEAAGADMMGFIFHPRSPRFVQEVPAYLPEHCLRVGVFVNADTDHMLQIAERFGLHLLQLHGDEPPEQCARLRQQGLGIIKAVGIRTAAEAAAAVRFCGCCDYLLFDTACSNHGGSGQSFDHSLLQAYTGITPFLLSGGIGPASVLPMHPMLAGVDLNSRVELRPGIKDAPLLASFINHLRNNIL